MGYRPFSHGRKIDADKIAIYHNDMTKLLQLDKGTADYLILTGLDSALKTLRLKACEGSVYAYIDIMGGDAIKLVTGHHVEIGSTPDHYLDAAGVHFFNETTTPTPKPNYGAIYTKNDNELYFQTGAGVEKTVTTV
jgi:hypothetical protein